MPRPLALTGITAHISTHYIKSINQTEKKEEKKLEIYILRQVNTLDKGFILSS